MCRSGLRSSPFLVAVALLPVWGCGGPEPAPSAAPGSGGKTSETGAAPANPEKALREQLRSGLFQLDACAASVEEALVAARGASKRASGEAQQGLLDVIDMLDSAGGTVADHLGESPGEDQVKVDYTGQDERRIRAIAAANDAHTELGEAAGLAGSLVEVATPPVRAEIEELVNLIEVAVEDARGAVEALGGTVEAPS